MNESRSKGVTDDKRVEWIVPLDLYAELFVALDRAPLDLIPLLKSRQIARTMWKVADAYWRAVLSQDDVRALAFEQRVRELANGELHCELPRPVAQPASSAPPSSDERSAAAPIPRDQMPTYLRQAPKIVVEPPSPSSAAVSAADVDATGAVDIRQLGQALMPFAGRVESIPQTEEVDAESGTDTGEEDAAGETMGLDIRQLAASATPFEDPLDGTALAFEIPADIKATPFSKPNTTSVPVPPVPPPPPEPTATRGEIADPDEDPVGETTGVDVRRLMAALTPFSSAGTPTSPSPPAAPTAPEAPGSSPAPTSPSSSSPSHQPPLPSLEEYVRLGVELASCSPERVADVLIQARMSRTMWSHVDATYRARFEREPQLRAEFEAMLVKERARRG